MPGADRAINMALRVRGIDQVEKDFRRTGMAGEKSFAQVKKAANGAAQEVSEYTARLRRVTAAAKAAFANIPDLNKGPADQVARNRRDFLLTAIETEKQNILLGKGEGTEQLLRVAGAYDELGSAATRTGLSLSRASLLGAAAGGAIYGLGQLVLDSIDAWQEQEDALDKFHASLAITGNFTSVAASEIEDMAERIRDATQQTEESVLDAGVTLSKVPGLGADLFEDALDASSRFADAMQTDVASVISDIVGPAFTALANKDLKAFYDATEGKLRPSLQKLVIDLAEAGRIADAQRALIDGLRDATGEGPNGLTTATDRATDAWGRLKRSLGENIAKVTAPWLEIIADGLDRITASADDNRIALSRYGNPRALRAEQEKAGGVRSDNQFTGLFDFANRQREAATELAARSQLEKRFGDQPKLGRGRSGKSSAEREAERLQREAESARNAADRVAESNADIAASYDQRASDVIEKIGLEGAALEAVERKQAIEAAVRRVNIDLIEKEVEARRAEAAATGQQFDLAAATAEATAQFEAQQDTVRRYATELVDAEADMDKFLARQREARQLVEALKSPMERFADDLERIAALRREGFLDEDGFERAMDTMAERLADIRYDLDETAQAWAGFGRSVGGTLADFIIDGGNALDVLRQIVRLALERQLEQQLVNPVADLIDGLTGNDRDRNVAAARASLPSDPGAVLVSIQHNADGAAISLTNVQTSGMAAAQALSGLSLSLGNPVDALAVETDQAAQALGGLVPITGQFGGALQRVLTMLANQSTGGGAGFLGSLLGLAGAAFGGAAPSAALAGDASATIAANPGLFASGTDRIPTGRPFWVGENGRELMEKDRAGNLRVYSNQQAHRLAGPAASGPAIGSITISVPARTDPRRTMSTVSRGVQNGLARAARKGLAAPAGR